MLCKAAAYTIFISKLLNYFEPSNQTFRNNLSENKRVPKVLNEVSLNHVLFALVKRRQILQ